MGALRKLAKPFVFLFVVTWDFGLFVLNFILPARKVGSVVPEGVAGHALNWPAYEPPKPTDSRSSCKTISLRTQNLAGKLC